MSNTKTKSNATVNANPNPAVITVDVSKARVEGANFNQTRLKKASKAKTRNDLVEIYTTLFGSNNYLSHLNYDIKKGAIVLES